MFSGHNNCLKLTRTWVSFCLNLMIVFQLNVVQKKKMFRATHDRDGVHKTGNATLFPHKNMCTCSVVFPESVIDEATAAAGV